MRLSTFTLVLATTALGIGCSAQVDPDYPGEPLGRIQGSLITGSTPAPPGIEVAILYYGFGPNWEKQSLGVSGPISAGSPGTFTMDIFSPPPPEAFGPVGWPDGGIGPDSEFQANKWTVGYIVALAPNIDKSRVRPNDILGVSLDYQILYFQEQAAPGSCEEWYASHYAVPGTKGYQLSAIYPLTLPERAAERAARDQCRWLPGLCVWQEDNLNTREYDTLPWQYSECMKRVPTGTSKFPERRNHRASGTPVRTWTTMRLTQTSESGAPIVGTTGRCQSPQHADDAMAVVTHARGRLRASSASTTARIETSSIAKQLGRYCASEITDTIAA